MGGSAVVRAAPKILSKAGNVINGVKGLFRTGPKDTPNLQAGTEKPLLLEAPKGTNPWLEGSEIVSIKAPKDFKINMAMSEVQTTPGGWGTLDEITNVNYVRNELAVTHEFKPEVSKVQHFLVPEGTCLQIGTVGPQEYNGITYPGGGNQVQILNYFDRNKLMPIGEPYIIK